MGDVSIENSLIEILTFGLLGVIFLWGCKIYFDCKKILKKKI